MPKIRRKTPINTTKPKKQRGKIDKQTGERILLVSHISRFIHMKWYLISVILLLLFAFLYLDPLNLSPIELPNYFDTIGVSPKMEFYNSPFLFILPVISLIIIILEEIKIHFVLETYVFTEKRMILKMSFLKKVETSLEYEMVSHYKLKQRVLQRLFDTGTIEIQSVAGTSSPEMMIVDAAGISKIKKLIAKQVIKTKGVFN